jgi:beta-glucosidase
MEWDGKLVITAKLTNSGGREATEVVQLYTHDVVASRVRPVRELKGFEKVTLPPGASTQVTFTLSREMLSFAMVTKGDVEADGPLTTVEPGMFDVWVGPSATAGGKAAQFELLSAARGEL